MALMPGRQSYNNTVYAASRPQAISEPAQNYGLQHQE
jgi:hypothetical protein